MKTNIAKFGKNESRKTITLKEGKTHFVIVKLGDQKFSFSMRDAGSLDPYVLIHHDTNVKEISFVENLNAKVTNTHESGSVYDVSIQFGIPGSA